MMPLSYYYHGPIRQFWPDSSNAKFCYFVQAYVCICQAPSKLRPDDHQSLFAIQSCEQIEIEKAFLAERQGRELDIEKSPSIGFSDINFRLLRKEKYIGSLRT